MALFCAPSPLPHESPLENLIDHGKRKLNESADANAAKRAKYLGPFIVDESDDEDSQQGGIPGSRSRISVTEHTSWLGTTETQIYETQGTPYIRAPSLKTRDDDAVLNTPRNTATPVEVTSNSKEHLIIRKCSGESIRVPRRKPSLPVSYEQLIASRSMTAPGRATKSYYGIEIHRLMEEARDTRSKDKRSHNVPKLHQSVESPSGYQAQAGRNTLWTEKYRARRFKDLIGDDRTHRAVLRWLKGWDPIVFPSLAKSKAQNKTADLEEPNTHRKILLLTGPPGLGKTTLAHVCAKQAGYEVLEINASDERSRDVVKGRIKDAVGTENVK
ncbi:predicted protein, partial [Uncinocarpus reesii 1704]